MTPFTGAELDYLRSQRLLGRIATVGRDGMPHVAPVGWRLDAAAEVVEITGHDVAATKKFRDVAHSGRAAVVIDDVLPPWQPRGIEIRGDAEAVAGPPAVIRIHPTRIISWGLDGGRHARTVAGPGGETGWQRPGVD